MFRTKCEWPTEQLDWKYMNYLARRCEKVGNKRRNSTLKRMRDFMHWFKWSQTVCGTENTHTKTSGRVLPIGGVYEHAFLCMLSAEAAYNKTIAVNRFFKWTIWKICRRQMYTRQKPNQLVRLSNLCITNAQKCDFHYSVCSA